MAGIGFTLRKLLKEGSVTSLAKGYGYAGIIGSGPWILSVLSIIAIKYLVTLFYPFSSGQASILFTLITWLIAVSQIFSGFFVLLFSRFSSDLLFRSNSLKKISSNLIGFLFVLTLFSVFVISIISFVFFKELSIGFQIIFGLNFILLNNIWLLMTLVVSLKKHIYILRTYAIGYSMLVLLTVWFSKWGITEMLIAVAIGHSFVFLSFIFAILKHYPFQKQPIFEFTQRKNIKLYLVFIGGFYYLGIWVDKIIFWIHPETSSNVYGPFKACNAYDIPFFLAILTAIPGMAVFLVRLETDFAENCHLFFDGLLKGDTIETIYSKKDKLVTSAKLGLKEVIKYQTVIIVLVLCFAEEILGLVESKTILISTIYQTFIVLVIGVGALVVFLSILNIMFYLDFRRVAFYQVFLMLFLNVIFTSVSIHLGYLFYGYGFTLSLVISCITGVYVLSNKFTHLEYFTFMEIKN